METKKIYLDNNSTTRVTDEAIDAMIPVFSKQFGNPSSLHHYGLEASALLEDSRKIILNYLNSQSGSQLIFTSGGTESNNLAIKGIAYRELKTKKTIPHIITTKFEHPSVLNTCKQLEKEGVEVTYLSLDSNGLINLDELKSSIKQNTCLVSIMAVNHEIGTIQDLKSIGNICKEHNLLFHTDACQAFGKMKLDAKEFNLDLITINSSKLHGPKGVGALYKTRRAILYKQIVGGHQEFDQRAGTENLPGIVGFAKAVQVAYDNLDQTKAKVTKLVQALYDGIKKEIPQVDLNGAPLGPNRIYNNLNMTFNYIEGEAILFHLNMHDICVSTGSACSSKSLSASHVLLSIGRNHAQSHGSIRFTFSKYNTMDDVTKTISALKQVVTTLRKLSPVTPKELR